jgi:hypothetical protein
MKYKEIVELAHQVGICVTESTPRPDEPSKLEQFAALIAQREREACAKLCQACAKKALEHLYKGGIL